MKVWSVSDVNAAVRALLESALQEVRVGGEVANWTRARSGHCYFTLKDERAQLRCVMWKSQAGRLPVDPEPGMRVRAAGRLTLYEARGDFQLSVRELEGEGEEGLWKIAFERLRQALEAEGLLEPARKRPVPSFPRTVGLVTSPTGAALHDVLTVLSRRAPWTRVLLRASRVQGEGAAQEIAAAIRTLGGSGLVDVLIVGRGGGSVEDLWAFNEEPVARAIADCPVPVISAVGHEVDVTISDLVADLRAPTPSAAAEAAVRDAAAIREVLASIRPRLARGLRSQAEKKGRRLDRFRHGVRTLGSRLATPHRLGLAAHRERLERVGRRRIESGRERLAHLAARVETLSPLSTLRRGYAVPVGPSGRVLRRASDFEHERRFELRVVDGRIDCEVHRVLPEPMPAPRGEP